jgi:O-antigen ligase
MGFPLAFLICSAGVAGLFYLDQDPGAKSAKALWLPVVWLWIIGSRPASEWLHIWFGFGQEGASGLDAQLDGSPVDAFVFFILILVGVGVLFRRKRQTQSLLRSCSPLFIYLFYCLLSCSWSPFPDVAFKRWIKTIGDLVMVLIILTDPKPKVALGRIFSRVGFVLLPASILLIRYTSLGRGFDPSGDPMNTGVATNKQLLGLIAYIVALGVLWNCIQLLRTRKSTKRSRRLVAQGSLLVFGLVILEQAHSTTSAVCFFFGAFLILTAHSEFIRRRPQRIQLLFSAIILFAGVGLLLGGEASVARALGKDPNLSDRTIIWAAAIQVCPNPLIGAGFESFWNGYGKFVTNGLSKYEQGLNEAHNGYIEVYLNLGWVGVSLIGMLLIAGYMRAYAAFRHNPAAGDLMLAILATVAIFGITEACFRIMTPSWMMFLVVFIGSKVIAQSRGAASGNLHSQADNSLRRAGRIPASSQIATARSALR